MCFLVPNADSAHRVVDELRSKGWKDEQIFVFANDETPLGDLPDAGLIQKSDFYPQLTRGLATGGAIGAIGGLVAMRVAGAVFGGGAVVLFALIGAGLNGLLSAIAGSAFPNSRLVQFEKAIAAGEVLVMVNVESDQVDDVMKLIKAHHPEVEIETIEPRAPVIPKWPHSAGTT